MWADRGLRSLERSDAAPLILSVMTRAESVPDAGTPAAGHSPQNHRAFLRYLERRVGDRALAEDILQDAFIKVVTRPEQSPADGRSSRGSTERCAMRRSISFGATGRPPGRWKPSRTGSRQRGPGVEMESRSARA